MHKLDVFKNSGAHDYEIGHITVNYEEEKIIFVLKTPENESCDFCVDQFNYFSITHKEAWGKGKYIYNSDLKEDADKGLYTLDILLNSGDQIIIEFAMDR